MALTLTLSKGSKIAVGPNELEVVHITRRNNFVVSCKGCHYTITDKKWLPIADGVELRAPLPKGKLALFAKHVRLQIMAPNYRVANLSEILEGVDHGTE